MITFNWFWQKVESFWSVVGRKKESNVNRTEIKVGTLLVGSGGWRESEIKLGQSRKWKCYLLSCVRLFVTPRTVAHQAPLSIRFSRQEYWTGLPFPSPWDLPKPGIKPGSPALQADSLPAEPPGKPQSLMFYWLCCLGLLQLMTGEEYRSRPVKGRDAWSRVSES